jgi:Arc/MetJ-type ribon-helix-helix transcriptional regulator
MPYSPLSLRLPAYMLDEVDAVVAGQSGYDQPDRSAVIRELLAEALQRVRRGAGASDSEEGRPERNWGRQASVPSDRAPTLPSPLFGQTPTHEFIVKSFRWCAAPVRPLLGVRHSRN